MTYACKNCIAMVAWDGRLWRETDGRAHCQTGGLHVPDTHDVACCDACIDGLSDPPWVRSRLQVLTGIPVGFTPHYNPHHNDGWDSRHQCATCYRPEGNRRVVTLTPEHPVTPERTTMPTAIAPIFDVSTVFVCADCLMVAANGPHPDDADLAPHTPLNRVPAGYHLVTVPEGDGDSAFSQQACPTCTTPYAGARHEAILMSIQPVMCQQCVDLVRHHH
jgi:hypothetical protein